MKKIIAFFFLIFHYTNSYSENIKSCNFYTEKYGKVFNLPNNLLTSISLVESGIKKEKNDFSSWPWTLNVSGRSIYFDKKEDVLNFLEKNADKKSIDVGCMQINTKYHLNNFENVSQMIEPEQNVKYAASFLSKLFKRHKSWNEAISRYHSSIPYRQKIYLKKVYSFWNNLRQKKIIIKTNYVEKNKEKVKFFREILEKEKI